MIATLSLFLILSTTEQAPPLTPTKPKLICVTDDVETGSHMHTGRRCKTEEEWQQEKARRTQVPTTLRVVPDPGDGAPNPRRPPLH